MRFLGDENFPGAGVAALRRRGHDVLSIGEVSRGANDAAVLDLATREAGIILTFDKDFGELARKSKLPDACGVILFRIPLPAPPPQPANASQSSLEDARIGRGISASSSPAAFACGG